MLSDFHETEEQKEIWIKEGDKYKKNDKRNRNIFRKIYTPIFEILNMGLHLCIDEKKIGKEVYTILSNKVTGKVIAMVESLKTKELSTILRHIPIKDRYRVKTISKDLANNFDWLARELFPNAQRIADKFHIIKLALESLQDVRIRYRQVILTEERERREAHNVHESKKKDDAIKQGEIYKKKHISPYSHTKMTNGDTKKELLARSRWLLFKRKDQWTDSQKERSMILFKEFPEIKDAYVFIEKFRGIYNRKPGDNSKEKAKKSLREWSNSIGDSSISEIQNFSSTVFGHENEILNYFDDGHTNAFAESLNAKIQRFVINNFGVRDNKKDGKNFFFFRLKKMLA